ncbi:Uncharacterised protein [Mycobacterium tuberculosis]|nr:Uncharacterised protein [Mycobacterium tuberculosis]
MHCGFESGDQNQSGDRPKFGLVELCLVVPAFGDLDQLTHQVVTRSVPQLLQMPFQPAVESSYPLLHTQVLPPRNPDV